MTITRRPSSIPSSVVVEPSRSARLLGLTGIVGGVVLLAAFLIDIAPELNIVRLVLFLLGAIAVGVGIHRRETPGSRRLSLAATIPMVVANAAYLVIVVLGIDRPQPPDPDPDFRLVEFFAGVALWWTDAVFAFAVLRIGAVSRWGPLALTVGSVLAFLGIDRLGLVGGPFEAIFHPLALAGVALSGLGWILLGLGLARRYVPGSPRPA